MDLFNQKETELNSSFLRSYVNDIDGATISWNNLLSLKLISIRLLFKL